MKKICTFRDQEGENRPPQPKNGIWGQKSCDTGILDGARKNIILGLKKTEKSPKTEFGAQNQYGRVIYPSIGNFTWTTKKHTYRGQKRKNKPSEAKNGIWGPKSIWSCDISIDRQLVHGV
jgi:hypothetical protein